MIAFAVLCLVLAAKLSAAASTGPPAQIAFVAAVFILPLLYACPGPRRLLARYRWPVLAAQSVLTCLTFPLFGASAVTGAALLAGLVLLTVPARLSWPLAGLLFASDLAVRAVLHGVHLAAGSSGVLFLSVAFIDDCLILFGLVRLADLVGEMWRAEGQIAGLAAGRERLRAAGSLQAAVGEGLAGIAAMVASAQQGLSTGAAEARSQIAAAGTAAREAAARARAMAVDHGGPPEPDTPVTGAGIAPRLAWAILVVVLSGFGLVTLDYVYSAGLRPAAGTAIAVSTVAIVALQLYHSRPDAPPRAWRLTLGVQVLLCYLPFAPRPAHYVGSLAGFAAGSALLLMPGRWRWAGYAAVLAGWSALFMVVPLVSLPRPGLSDLGYVTALNAGIGLMVYGLSQLAGTARQLAVVRGELARMAVVRERLRVARDVHDLLGLGLSAIALKADLIGALAGRDGARAAAEIQEMGRICAQARADIRLVTEGSRQLPLDAELAAARDILASAGVNVRAAAWPPPAAAAGGVLAPVLREAVTNVLRHSAATTCTVEVTAGDGALRLRIANDGVTGQPTASGSGLANLTGRVRAVGGSLAASQADGWFTLSAEIPLVPSGSQPAGLRGDAHRVHPVAGAELGDR